MRNTMEHLLFGAGARLLSQGVGPFVALFLAAVRPVHIDGLPENGHLNFQLP